MNSENKKDNGMQHEDGIKNKSENMMMYLHGCSHQVHDKDFLNEDTMEKSYAVRSRESDWAHMDEGNASKDNKTPSFISDGFGQYLKNAGMQLNTSVKEDGTISVTGDKKQNINVDVDCRSGNVLNKRGYFTKEERLLINCYDAYLLSTFGRKAISEREFIKENLSHALDLAQANLGVPQEFAINNIKINVMESIPGRYDISAKIEIGDKTYSLLEGKQLTKEELLSNASINKISQCIGAGTMMKADDYLAQQLGEKDRLENEKDKPDTYVYDDGNELYRSMSKIEVADRAATAPDRAAFIDNPTDKYECEFGKSPESHDDEDEIYGERSLF